MGTYGYEECSVDYGEVAQTDSRGKYVHSLEELVELQRELRLETTHRKGSACLSRFYK
jgi:hypothetical protein